MGLKSKDLLGMKQLTAEEIMEILDTAKTMKMVITSGNKKTSHLSSHRNTWARHQPISRHPEAP